MTDDWNKVAENFSVLRNAFESGDEHYDAPRWPEMRQSFEAAISLCKRFAAGELVEKAERERCEPPLVRRVGAAQALNDPSKIKPDTLEFSRDGGQTWHPTPEWERCRQVGSDMFEHGTMGPHDYADIIERERAAVRAEYEAEVAQLVKDKDGMQEVIRGLQVQLAEQEAYTAKIADRLAAVSASKRALTEAARAVYDARTPEEYAEAEERLRALAQAPAADGEGTK